MNIIITGASRGFGRAIAEKFAEDKQGNTLVLCARDKDRLELMAKHMQARFPRTTVLSRACDVTDKQQLNEFSEWAHRQTGKIDILINNAGSFLPGSVHEEADGVLEAMLSVNLISAYTLSRLIIPGMKAQQSGHIFNMCSIASLKSYKNGGAYSISKFALSGLTRNLREELKSYNIKVTGVYPGAAYTDSWAGSGIAPERIMEARDIASMIYTAAHLSPQACVEDIIMRPQLGDL